MCQVDSSSGFGLVNREISESWVALGLVFILNCKVKNHLRAERTPPFYCSAKQHFLSVKRINILSDRLDLAVLHLEHQVIIVLVEFPFGALAAGDPLHGDTVTLGDGVAHLNRDAIRLK